jgi:hypothetical protein
MEEMLDRNQAIIASEDADKIAIWAVRRTDIKKKVMLEKQRTEIRKKPFHLCCLSVTDQTSPTAYPVSMPSSYIRL